MVASARDRRNKGKSRARPWTFSVVLMFLTLMVLFFAGGVWQKINDKWDTFTAEVGAETDDVLTKAGCTLSKVLIRGLNRTDKQEMMKVIDLETGILITKIDIDQLKNRIEAMPWVETAVVQRHFPDTIKVDVTEHYPVALWQKKGNYYVITSKGLVLGRSARLRASDDLPVISGEGAPLKTPELLVKIAQNKEVFDRFKGAVWIGARRWDIFLDSLSSGLVIKLPENGVETSMQRLKALQENYAILKRKLTLIDLRLPEKLTVRL